MPGAGNIQLDEQSQEKLKSLAASRTSGVRLWERATIVMELAAVDKGFRNRRAQLTVSCYETSDTGHQEVHR